MSKEAVPADEGLLALLLEANRLRGRQEYRAALAVYRRILDQYGESPALLAAISRAHFLLAASSPEETGEDYQEAITWAQRAVARAPHDSSLRGQLADFLALGALDYQAAAAQYREALRLDPCDVTALVGAAGLYGVPECVVTLDEAIGWLERASTIQPDEHRHYVNLGYLYHEAGREADALRAWSRALLCGEPVDETQAASIQKMARRSAGSRQLSG